MDDTIILKQLNEKIMKYLERIKEKKNEKSSEEERGGRKEERRGDRGSGGKIHPKPHRIGNSVQSFCGFSVASSQAGGEMGQPG